MIWKTPKSLSLVWPQSAAIYYCSKAVLRHDGLGKLFGLGRGRRILPSRSAVSVVALMCKSDSREHTKRMRIKLKISLLSPCLLQQQERS